MGCAKEIVNYLHTINGLAILVVKLKQFLNRKKNYILILQQYSSMDAVSHHIRCVRQAGSGGWSWSGVREKYCWAG